ncbi:MAG TPA: hypothetical protein VHY81_07330 [Acidimicrobiales bacterium]|nr:hypothetical protein [Acidimicrobiales bacterium]
MTFTDCLIDISLIALVLVQVKSRRLTVKALLIPIGIVAYVAFNFLKGIPTAHNDLFLVIGAIAIGGTLGGLAGKFTTVTRRAEGVFAKAGLAAAALWILGTGGRLAFQVWATHGGGPAIAHFSATHGITSATAWTAALILMALSEVVVRTGVLAWRSGLLSEGAARALGTAAPATVPPASTRPVPVSRVRSRTLVPSGTGSMMDSSDGPLS